MEDEAGAGAQANDQDNCGEAGVWRTGDGRHCDGIVVDAVGRYMSSLDFGVVRCMEVGYLSDLWVGEFIDKSSPRLDASD